MRSGIRMTAAACVAALAGAGAAACGPAGGSHPGAGRATTGSASAAHAVQAAYLATTKAKTATFRLAEMIRAKSASGSQSAAISGSGQADFAAKAFTASLNVPGGGAVKVLLVHGTEYVQVPAAIRSHIPGHKAWVSVNLNKVSQGKFGESFSQFAGAGNDDPAQFLSQLTAVSSGVSKAGPAVVAGVPTTEYRAQINLNKVAARAQARQGPRAAQAVREKIKALGTATVPVRVWIDAQHRVRQVRSQVPIPAASAGGGTAVLTMTFTSFGAPVHLSPPPAGQTADITSEVAQHATASSG